MKRTTRVLTFLMALAMIFSLGVNALAATETNAIIDTGKTASLDIYKYDLTRAEDDGAWDVSSYVSTGTYDSSVNSTLGDTSFTNNSGTNNTAYGYAIKGVKFSYLKVADICTYSERESGVTKDMTLYGMLANDSTNSLLSCLGLSYANAYHVEKLNSTTNMYYFVSDVLVNALSASLADNSTATKNALETYMASASSVVMPETDQYGHTSASGLPLGLYLVVETSVPDMVTSTVDPFFVSLPMTTIDGNNWNYNVTVYPKNHTGMPTLEKTVREAKDDTGHNNGSTSDISDGYAHTATASAGDKIEYQVISTFPSITSEVTYPTSYTFEDILSPGFSYIKNDIVIEIFKDAGCTDRVATWKQSDDVQRFTVAYSTDSDSNTIMTIAMTSKGLAEINTSSAVYSSASLNTGYSDCTMRITYGSIVNSNASVTFGSEGNPNHIQLTWKRSNTTYYDVLDADCHIFTYGIDLMKQFSDGNGDYSKVKMILRNSSDGYYVKAELDKDGSYYVTGHVTAEADATVFVPTSTGNIFVKGLEDDTYIITELETDSGYTLLKDNIEVKISVSNGETCKICHESMLVASAKINGDIVSMDADGTSAKAYVPLTVVNTRGFDLPQTGGNGNWMYPVLGLALLALSATALLLIRKKRS